MTREEIIGHFKDSAQAILGVDPSSITASSSLQDDLNADSLDVVEVIMGVEEALDTSFPDDLWDGVNSVGEAADRILVFLGTAADSTAR